MEYAQLHTEILGDPKLMRAARKGLKGLELAPWFFAFAKKANDSGRLTIGGEAVEPADFVNLIPGATSRSIAVALKSLESIGVLVRDEDGALRFAAWDTRQAKSSVQRVQKFRERHAGEGGDRTATEYVYYARDGNEVKIGRSQNPWARCNEMRTARPNLVLIAVEAGDRALERQRQEELGGRVDFHNHTRGAEWFPWGEKFEQFLATLAAVESRSETTTNDSSETSCNTTRERIGNQEEPNLTETPHAAHDRRTESRALPHTAMDRLRTGLPEPYHPDLDALLARVGDQAAAWCGELTMAVEGGTAGTAVTYEALGRALRDYRLNGKAAEPNIAHFRTYVTRAAGDRRRPARAGPTRNSPDRAATPATPLRRLV